MRPLRIASLALGLTFAATGCAHQSAYLTLEQRLHEPEPLAPETLLSSDQIRADIALARLALERGYGGRNFVPATSWQATLDALERLSSQSLSVQAFCDALAEAFWQLPDAHLSAKRQTIPERSNARCGSSFKAASRKASVGANRGAAVAKERPWAFESMQVGNTLVGVLSIMRFPSRDAPEWKGFDDAVTSLGSSDAAIIDLRGNGGGDDARGYQVARALVDGPVQTGVLKTHLRQTPETLTLLLNTLDRIARKPDGSLEDYMRESYAEVEAWRRSVLKTASPEYLVREKSPYALHLGERAFKGPIAVLVDASCGSSCESTLEVLRRHPRARVFGERTAGYIHFGDVGSLTLPHSGIRLGIPTKFHEYPSGAFFDKVGFEPDVVVSPGSDALDSALDWLRPSLRESQGALIVPRTPLGSASPSRPEARCCAAA